ncbi:hypothetical protein V8B97DRAFT_348568 [Scleroderma yunnanense]
MGTRTEPLTCSQWYIIPSCTKIATKNNSLLVSLLYTQSAFVMMFARATLIICAFFFMMPTTLGAAIGKPNFQTRDTEELNMPLRRSAVDTRKTGAIWIGRAYQHTREEEVEAPQHAPAPAVRDEGMEVHRVARTKGAVWQGNEHEDTQEKVRRKASTNAANKRRAPVPTPLNSVISQRFEHEEANYHRREVNPGTCA